MNLFPKHVPPGDWLQHCYDELDAKRSYFEQGISCTPDGGVIPGEEWRTLERYPNYAFSSFGRVMRTKGAKGCRAGRVLKAKIHSTGYPMVSPSVEGVGKWVKVHQLICEAFHGPKPSQAHQVAHADGDRTNSRADNLRWATQVENELDKWEHGTRTFGEGHPSSKYDEATIVAIRSAKGTHEQIGNRFGISRRYIGYIRSGKRWLYSGHKEASNA